MKKTVLQLVDSIEYVSNNCFQHQLAFAMKQMCDVRMLPINMFNKTSTNPKDFDVIVSTLKQRTLFRQIEHVKQFLNDLPVVIFDQDPWEAFRDGSQFKGSYETISGKLNVSFFAVTTKWWTDFIEEQGLASKFVRMWMLPDYCQTHIDHEKRSVNLGFIGQVHPYRKQLFNYLKNEGYPVDVMKSVEYQNFLNTLGTMKVFIHSESAPITINGMNANLGTGLWIKDVEAAARGAFSIRNRQEGSETYLKGIETVKLYDSMEEVPAILEDIKNLKSHDRQEMINRSVKFIKESNLWNETVTILIS